MTSVHAFAELLVRQATDTAAAVAAATSGATPDAAPACEAGNTYDGRLGIRVSAIFVILVTATLGTMFPVFARRHQGLKVPEWVFFFAKYFGSGIIIATAFIHLLAPAHDALTDDCLTGAITEYAWVEGIALMTIFVMFIVELMALRYSTFGRSMVPDGIDVDDGQHPPLPPGTVSSNHPLQARKGSSSDETSHHHHPATTTGGHVPGDDHLSHARRHRDFFVVGNFTGSREDYVAHLTAVFILEFGVIFHSIFIGLTLAVAGEEFNTLYVVLVFHQTFEGLGLGSRLAVTPWPRHRLWTPYALALLYGVSTPVAIAVGLGVRNTYAPGTQTALVVNGVFDSISAGILIYTGLVELMAHEFMFSEVMRKARVEVVVCAYGIMCVGAGLMALLGKWA